MYSFLSSFRLPLAFSAFVAVCLNSGRAADLLLDNFNANGSGAVPSGWEVVATGGTIAVDHLPSASDKSIRMAKTGLADSVAISRSFTPQSGKVAVEIRVRAVETNGTKNVPDISGSNGTTAASVVFEGGFIYAFNGSVRVSLQAFTAGTWYLVRVEMDTVTGKYDLYVDGVRKLTNAGLRNTVSDIAKITCGIHPGFTGTVYVDNVNIYTMEIPPMVGSYLALEDFNAAATGSSPQGWTTAVLGGTVSVQEIPFRGDKSLRLQKAGSANAVQAVKSFPVSSGRVTLEVKARTEDASGTKTIIDVRSSDGNSLAAVTFVNSALYAYNGTGNQNIATIKAGTWFSIRVVLNTATGKFDLYVDAKRVLSGASFRSSASNAASVSSGIDAGNTGTMYIDNLRVSTQASLIGDPPPPVFDVAAYGAIGNGVTKDTAAIQAAINACAGSGGSVYLHDGTFLTGTIELKSGMTLYVDASAVLRGSGSAADYPNQNVPLTGGVENIGLESKKVLIFLRAASNVKIDGGGRIEGNGMNWNDRSDANRPLLILPAMCNTVAIRNLYLEESAMWCLVPFESRYVGIRNLNIYNSLHYNRDGIDIVDCRQVLVERCTIFAEDDAICPKSGIRTGLEDILIRDCFIAGSTRANGVKFGTRSYGQLTNFKVQDLFIKNTDKAAIALESVDGSDISDVAFRRIEIRNTSSPFYLIIGKRGERPANDVQKIGSIQNILFEDISGADLKYNIGSPISGSILNGVEYPLKNIVFRRVNIAFKGGSSSIPGTPPEMGTQYPECNLWGNMPAYGYFLRHIDNVTFTNCSSSVSPADARPLRALVDVGNLIEAVPAGSGNLVITKVQYHPSPPSLAETAAGFGNAADFAFIELMNIGNNVIDLSGVAFTEGLQFTFTDFLPVHTLAAGQRVLVVGNLAAFQFRYGMGLPVAGVFEGGVALLNRGGQIRLLGEDGSNISEFAFDHSLPWPGGADGSGRSLVLLRPATNPDPAAPENWRSSSTAQGSPGADDRLFYAAWRSSMFSSAAAANNAISGPAADPDNDGRPNLLEYAAGSNPLSPDSGSFTEMAIEPVAVDGITGNYALFRYRYRPAAEDIEFTPVVSPDLRDWSAGNLVPLSMIDHEDGSVTATYRSVQPASQEPARFFRLNAVSQP